MKNSYFAYEVRDREEEGPNLRAIASQPWMGLTAYIREVPHLVIGRISDTEFVLEDQSGNQFKVDFTFPWDEPTHESSRLVAASRVLESPFREAGYLRYDSTSGEWSVIRWDNDSGLTDQTFDIEAHVAHLEENNWRYADIADEIESGNFDKTNDVVVPVHGKCPHCGSDSISYADDEDQEDIGPNREEDPVVLCHACHQWCRQSEVDSGPDDASDNQHQDDRLKTEDDPDDKINEPTPKGLTEEDKYAVSHYVPRYADFRVFGASETIPVPTYAVHNQTSALFGQSGITATVHLPHGPSVTLPFSSPMDFMKIMKWKMNDYPAATGGGDPVGAPMVVESDQLPEAISLIQQAGEADPNARAGSWRLAELGESTNDDAADQITDRPEKAIQCPKCGSHTLETVAQDEDEGSAEWLCLTCGNMFNADYRKKAGVEHPKGTRVEITHPDKKGIKGLIQDHVGQDDNFGDALYDVLCENGDELKKVPGVHLKKVKSTVEASIWIEADSDDDGDDESANYESEPCANCKHSKKRHADGKCDCGCTHYSTKKESAFFQGQQVPIQDATGRSVMGVVQTVNPGGSYEVQLPDGTTKTFFDNEIEGQMTQQQQTGKVACFMCGHEKGSETCSECGYTEKTAELWKDSLDVRYPENFGKKFIMVQQLIEPADTLQFIDPESNKVDPRLGGFVTSTGGETAHAIVVARPLGLVCIYAEAANLAKVQPGDKITIRRDGIIDINGGDPNFQGETLEVPKMIYRFAWSLGNGAIAKIDPNNPDMPGTLHQDLMSKLFTEGKWDPNFEDGTFGVWYSRGNVGIENNPISDAQTLVQWIHHQAAENGAPLLDIKFENLGYFMNEQQKTIPPAGGTGEAWSFQGVPQVPGEVQDAVVVKPNQMSPEDVLRLVDSIPTKRDEMHKHVEQQNAEHGTNFKDRYDNPFINRGGSVKLADGFELAEGNWYTMHSPEYIVPDVIHVQSISGDEVTAAIEGDDKGLFPIKLKHSEIEDQGYTFTPYSPFHKEARANYSANEQHELVNENLLGRARNFHKLDLEGTHYPRIVQASALSDPLYEEIHWW